MFRVYLWKYFSRDFFSSLGMIYKLIMMVIFVKIGPFVNSFN